MKVNGSKLWWSLSYCIISKEAPMFSLGFLAGRGEGHQGIPLAKTIENSKDH